ncbi:sce7726 family protein [Labilibaculum euxinus]|uniref:Sce7726 family protein n=1 Tax=Labilibaculum euxinus TaxID=2686357 RepID=A0A7M4D510_9BACT|nr:sce7726 family protein [Labilibaculum euxinus]MUP37739.1 sce7726 family protein [Labilibaculum euxinus]MVB06944.1 sce7726 family protein [Labilibaculum euxinus]
MSNNNTNISQKEKLRSYSTIFSSTSFNRLLLYNDYSFINHNIKTYDISKIGSLFENYYEYIRFVYGELRKQYRNEYIYKNTLINEILIKKYSVKETIAINEFRVGNSIADIVMFNGTSKAFEIKTELDSNTRLKGQLNDYTKIFKENYIVTHESLVDKYLKEDASAGIIQIVECPRSLKIEEIRPVKINNDIDPNILIRSLRTEEYKSIVKNYYGSLPKMTSFNMFKICSELIQNIPQESLNSLFINQMKKRKSNMNEISSFYKELRQIGLAMNLDQKNYNKLQSKLTAQINI